MLSCMTDQGNTIRMAGDGAPSAGRFFRKYRTELKTLRYLDISKRTYEKTIVFLNRLEMSHNEKIPILREESYGIENWNFSL